MNGHPVSFRKRKVYLGWNWLSRDQSQITKASSGIARSSLKTSLRSWGGRGLLRVPPCGLRRTHGPWHRGRDRRRGEGWAGAGPERGWAGPSRASSPWLVCSKSQPVRVPAAASLPLVAEGPSHDRQEAGTGRLA